MSTNKEEMQDNLNKNDINLSSKKWLFLRVCYRHKCKLRSFECFPSFKQLINEIKKIYPSIESKLNLKSHHDKKSKNKKHKNIIDQNWRLETNESDWIEHENDWKVMIQFLKHQKSKNSNDTNNNNDNNGDKNKKDSSSNNVENKKPIHLTLHVMFEDEEDDNYNPEAPSFVKCYKNPITLINQR